MKRRAAFRDAEFEAFLEREIAELPSEERAAFERFRVPPWAATLHRGMRSRDEPVPVVAEVDEYVVYYDEVEDGFEFSRVDDDNRILDYYCNQGGLIDVIRTCMMKL